MASGFVLDGLQNNDTLKECLAKSDAVIVVYVSQPLERIAEADNEVYLLNLNTGELLYKNDRLPLNLIPREKEVLQFVLKKENAASLSKGDKLILFLKVEYSKLPYYSFSDERFGIQKYTDALAASINGIYQEKE